jgi:hypothetical protein
MSQAAYATGTIRTIAGYEVAGNAGLAGSTYNVNLWGWYSTPASEGISAFVRALKAEALLAGALRLSISGNAIMNPAISTISVAAASRYGFSIAHQNATSIVLQCGLR